MSNLIYTMTEDDFDGIEAVMAPDFQLTNRKAVPEGTVIEVAHCLQTTATDRNGEEKISTTLITPSGKSYQTLSNYVDRLLHTISQKRPAETWKENPVKLEMRWKETNNGNHMIAPRLIK